MSQDLLELFAAEMANAHLESLPQAPGPYKQRLRAQLNAKCCRCCSNAVRLQLWQMNSPHLLVFILPALPQVPRIAKVLQILQHVFPLKKCWIDLRRGPMFALCILNTVQRAATAETDVLARILDGRVISAIGVRKDLYNPADIRSKTSQTSSCFCIPFDSGVALCLDGNP